LEALLVKDLLRFVEDLILIFVFSNPILLFLG